LIFAEENRIIRTVHQNLFQKCTRGESIMGLCDSIDILGSRGQLPAEPAGPEVQGVSPEPTHPEKEVGPHGI
jgi:hypothetical protein